MTNLTRTLLLFSFYVLKYIRRAKMRLRELIDITVSLGLVGIPDFLFCLL